MKDCVYEGYYLNSVYWVGRDILGVIIIRLLYTCGQELIDRLSLLYTLCII